MAHELDRNSDAERRLSDDESGSPDATQHSQTNGDGGFDRRSFLRAGLAATALGAAAMGSGTASAATVRDVPFDRVVDAVDDLGMDPNGNAD